MSPCTRLELSRPTLRGARAAEVASGLDSAGRPITGSARATGSWPLACAKVKRWRQPNQRHGSHRRERALSPNSGSIDRLVSRFRSSQALAARFRANFGIKRDTSKHMTLVWFLDLKFLCELAAYS